MKALKWQAEPGYGVSPGRNSRKPLHPAAITQIAHLEPLKAQITFTAADQRPAARRHGFRANADGVRGFLRSTSCLLAHHRESARLCVTTNLAD